MKLRKILCATDFSSDARRALDTAIRLALRDGSEVVLAHAWQMPQVYGDAMLAPTLLQDLVDADRHAFDKETAYLHGRGVRHASHFVQGNPWVAITELAKEDPAIDLVIVGTHGRTGAKRFFLGSVAEQIVRHAPCSVMVVREDELLGHYDRMLCPVDFSVDAALAIERAAQLADPHVTKLELLHVIEVPASHNDSLSLRTKDELDQVAGRAHTSTGLEVSTRLRYGSPRAEIVDEIGADPTIGLIVLGSHGRTGLRRMLLGSVAEGVVRHARCSVVIARPLR